MKRAFACLIALLAGQIVSPMAVAGSLDFLRDENDREPWQESAYKLPAFPKDGDLLEFYVSPTATAKYYIDRNSIDAGHEDDVVRYTMVIKAAGGATNVTYEGLHCDANKLRLYATGRSDGTWAEVPNSEWKTITGANKRQWILARYYFCPGYIAIYNAAEGVRALKNGVHPNADPNR